MRFFPSVHDIPPGYWKWGPEFRPQEFVCRGSGGVKVVPEFMDRLLTLRKKYGKPMTVSSGYRSPEHNVRVSSTGPKGPHTTGRAVDIQIQGSDVLTLTCLAVECGFTGVGWNQKGGGRFVHLDDLNLPVAPRPTVWTY